MAYTVDYSDSTKTAITVNDGAADTTTNITLVGKNYSRYGEIIAEDLLHLLENFADGTAPTKPVEGQLWYDNGNQQLSYYDDRSTGTWKGIAQLSVDTTAPTVNVNEGHFWLDTSSGQLYIWNGTSWASIGNSTGVTRLVARTRKDTTGSDHQTIETIVNGEIVSIHSSDTTAWAPGATGGNIEYLEDGSTLLNTEFPTIQPGINLNTTSGYVFNGTATSAQYADLAERYEADMPLAYGTVVELGGAKEITKSTVELSDTVFGIVSTQPGLMLNSTAGTDETHPYVALAGRVPCYIVGKVNKGDRIVTSDVPGHARAARPDDYVDWRHVIGRAIETKINDEPGLIEVVVGAK